MKKIFLLLMFLIVSITVFSQERTFRGTVTIKEELVVRDTTINDLVSAGTNRYVANSNNYIDGGNAALLDSNSIVKKDEIKMFHLFGYGVGKATDTLDCFVGADLGAWYYKDTDTLVITSLYNILGDGIGTDSLFIQIYVGTSYGTPTDSLFNGAPLILSLTGNEITSFTVSKIVGPIIIWAEIRQVALGNKPVFYRGTLSGYTKTN